VELNDDLSWWASVGGESCRNAVGCRGHRRGAVVELLPSVPSVEVGHMGINSGCCSWRLMEGYVEERSVVVSVGDELVGLLGWLCSSTPL
jgi:hypothetical protein